MKKFALVLGGGSAKGFAHVGILKILEKHGIIPDLIVGTSMGAVIGGIYAVDKDLEDLEYLSKKFDKLGSFNVFSALFKGNLLSPKRFEKSIKRAVGEAEHLNTKIPFVAVATDIIKGKETCLKNGKVKDSIIASASIPGVFPYYKIGENCYCDGGLMNNLPEDVAKKLMPDAVIMSVDVIGEYSKQIEKTKIKSIAPFLNASTLMTTQNVKRKEQIADLRITITQPQVSQMDFSKDTTEKTIARGEMYMRKNIKKLKELLND
ncbi:MAG: hypothetical protein E7374_03290 [Clostridiales bacterium]|nr:hypothetical protein [Clostridiales bacterium]